jgi:hypothetical protein
VLRLAYTRIGLGPHVALALLLASLAGSYLNIPIAQLPERHFMTGEEVPFFGMRYVIPVVIDWPGTVIAVNVGGAVIPWLAIALLVHQAPIVGSGRYRDPQRRGSVPFAGSASSRRRNSASRVCAAFVGGGYSITTLTQGERRARLYRRLHGDPNRSGLAQLGQGARPKSTSRLHWRGRNL